MPVVHLLTFGDAAHAAAAEALCPESALPAGWTRIVGGYPNDVAFGTEIVAVPKATHIAASLTRPGRIVVCGHGMNTPVRIAAPWRAGLVAVGARSSAYGAALATSYGPGMLLAVDAGALYPANAQSWAVYGVPVYLARAWDAHGTAGAAQASLVHTARAASGQTEWSEQTGYGVLPALLLPAPGALLSTSSPSWTLHGSPAGGSITADTQDGRTGVRIVAGPGSDRLRARALDGVAYVPGRLYRRLTYARNLSSSTPAPLVSRASEAPFVLAPNEAFEAEVWETKSANPTSGYDPSWQLRSGLVADDPSVTLDVFVAETTVETYEASGPLTLSPLADPDPVAPFILDVSRVSSGIYALTWTTLPDPAAECIVSVDGEDVAVTTAGAATVSLSEGPHEVRVRLTTGETEAHSVVTVTSLASAVSLQRGRSTLFATWAPVPGAASYRVEFAASLGGAPFAVVETTGRAAEAEFDGAAEARIIAIDDEGAESEVGQAYAAGAGTPSRHPLYT